ncbi:hypothetical protein DB32_000910 [Sandaracinus amylolyticus]|uniref:DUF1549 domain-containing protein n=1 Tax=Sandaracinus amylolyticus TaxID=927083 RepID=A0A0F6VZQ6_9BACT|nr:hypothetical protein DB32_000910 [Sandaracinus amylolyticus]
MLLAVLLAACGGTGGAQDDGGIASTDAQCTTTPTTPPDDPLSATRRLRRMTLALTDRMPSRERLSALAAITEPDAQDAFLDAELERLLAEPAFYDAMVDFGHAWVSAPPVGSIADAPEYGLLQQRTIRQCPAGTLHAGKWGSPNIYADNQPCNGLDADGNPTVVRTVEPWWAEGTTIEVVGRDGDDRVMITARDGTTIDCGDRLGAGFSSENYEQCGCGPHLVWCNPNPEGLQNYSAYGLGYPDANRRHTWDEPARLLAHVAWHDRPLTDLIAGTYSVGPVSLQATYVRYGRRLSGPGRDDDDAWWRASRWSTPHDPHHDANDPRAWSEFDVTTRNPFLLADRHYRFDPRVEPSGTMRGVPAAGVLTSPGLLASWVRERVAGARTLEMFACENFVPPPPTAHFAPYEHDPASGGPCMHCHTRIDPASIHFKRFMRVADDYAILGVGDAHYGDAWVRGVYPFNGDPWERMNRLWLPGSRMTPVSADEAMREPETRFIDFLPPDQTLYGRTSDGTVGPLGLAHLLIDSGAFDRCAVRRLHRRFVGRDVDPTAESGYLDRLVAGFVEDGRRVRPFVRRLVDTDAFGRGL